MNIAQFLDHTILKPNATEVDILREIEAAREHRFASLCLNPCWVSLAARAFADTGVAVCTVVGFPLGASTTEDKIREARHALDNGADEIDMVINIGFAKSGRFDDVTKEIRAVKQAAGDHILKVIVETCLLSEEEKIRLCQCVEEAGADYIKTSTGFSTGGATLEDVQLFRKSLGDRVKIKASGGIKTKEQAEAFLAAGCSRIGTSSGAALL